MSKRKRNYNHRLVKVHRTYTVEEISKLFGVHKNSVHRWLKEGLGTTDSKKPLLVLGVELRGFLAGRRALNKRPCKAGQLYCLRCRAPKDPAGGMVDYLPRTPTTGNLVGICPDCSTMMYRGTSVPKLEALRALLDITLREPHSRIGESLRPTVNSDLKQ